MSVPLTITFKDEDQLAGWAAAARALGAIPDPAGVRKRDALDKPGNRAHPGEYVLTAEPGCGGWIVPPAPERPDALDDLVDELAPPHHQAADAAIANVIGLNLAGRHGREG